MGSFQEILGGIREMLDFIMGSHSRLWPAYILVMIGICFALYLRGSRRTGFLSWAFPKDMYLHKSHMTDIKLFIFGRLIAFFGFFNFVAISTVTATWVIHAAGGMTTGDPKVGPILTAFILALATDFAVYWVHRVHHETPSLWPFHAVHHSAEVMTPITVYRKHPVYDIISTFAKGLLTGLTQGVLLALFVGKVDVSTIAGINAGYFIFNVIGSNLRHSHIWLSYGRILEHIFISPAQHQIHHSIEPNHFNKNYGEVFAFWDWMFGHSISPKRKKSCNSAFATGQANRSPNPTPD